MDLSLPDQDRITRRAGALLEQFKELVYPSDYDPEQKPSAKRKVIVYTCRSLWPSVRNSIHVMSLLSWDIVIATDYW